VAEEEEEEEEEEGGAAVAAAALLPRPRAARAHANAHSVQKRCEQQRVSLRLA
jgi:hypothetical protein